MLSGHLHRHVKKAPEANGWRFPILVNSNATIIKAKADARQLQIDVFDLQGKKIDALMIAPSK